MLIKEKVRIPYLKTSRMLHIYIPDHLEKQERLPVFYMFDGHNLFVDEDSTYGKSWGILPYFKKHNIRCIVVGIECNHNKNYRLQEFSPYSFTDDVFGVVKANGKKFFKWMTTDLKQYIDAKYPTLPQREFTYLGGSSMGGLMSVYGGAMHSDVYSKCACLSPFYDHIIKYLLTDLKKANDLKDSLFYISFGRHEFANKQLLARGVEENLAVMRILTEKGAKCLAHCFEHGDHSEASWEKEIPIFLKDLNIK